MVHVANSAPCTLTTSHNVTVVVAMVNFCQYDDVVF
jgi:hypothetical protein